VKIILPVFLWMLSIPSIRMARTGFQDISGAWRVALQAVDAGIARIIGLHIYTDIKEIRRYDREPEDGCSADRHP
jgi:hypothetical protein